MKLHLGVIDGPHGDALSTGDLAGYLESRYHPMEHFFQIHGQEVADDMADGVAGVLESLMMGAPATVDPFGTAMGKTEERFRVMLETGELEKLGYPGLPTEAAKKRRSLRFKAKRNPKGRPSLIDTGLYQSSFKSWVDGAPMGDR